MARTASAVKDAVRNHKGRILSSFWWDGKSPINEYSISLTRIQEQQAHLERNRRAVADSLENLLPIEEGMRSYLERNLAGTDELLSTLKPRAHRYPTLSLEPLTLRDENGYPKLVLMALDQPGKMEISGWHHSSDRKGWSYNPLCGDNNYQEVREKVIDRCYRDVGSLLQAKAQEALRVRGEAKVTISMELGNLLIPPTTRAKIKKARQYFGEQIFMIVEAKEWVENTVVKPDPDPIIVGYEDGFLFVIDVFDLKPIEALALEF